MKDQWRGTLMFVVQPAEERVGGAKAMVEDGLIAPHPRYKASATSGYRLLESAYAELIRKCPAEIRGIVPQWEQVHWEGFHSQFVAGVDLDDWRRMLLLEEEK